MRVALRLLLLAALVTPAAGCLGGAADEARDDPPTPATSNLAPLPASRFAIADLRVVPETAHEPPLREDDAAIVRYTVRNDGDVASSQFVSLLVDGRVVQADSIRLGGGQERRFEHRIAPLYDMEAVRVQVRAGDKVANATAPVELWPRVKGNVDLGVETVRVERWTQNETRGGVDVNLTIKRPEGPVAPDPNLRVTLLCLAARDEPEPLREAPLVSPRPGARAELDVPFPSCENPYGVELRLTEESGRERLARVLFVPADWRPQGIEDA